MSSVLVFGQGSERKLYCQDGTKLIELLRRNGYVVTAPCGGRGKCGKCRVTVVMDGAESSVLACETEVCGDMTIYLPEAAQGGEILSATVEAENFSADSRTGLGAAVDVGTTTVVLRLFELSNGRELGSKSAWNAQAPYGADVLSRCQYIMEHTDGLELLSGLIRRQTMELLRRLCHEQGREPGQLREIFIAGNTIMQHIFAGISPASIATAPFTPKSLFDDRMPSELEGIALSYAPCVAGYVGGDITAGLLATDIGDKHSHALFIDVGTNGEMAIGGRDGFISCAVACGPAFEGAGISCGMAGLPGAISHVDWNKGFEFQVVGGAAPRGICGSGLVDLLALLLRLGLVDESGRLLPPDEAPEGFEAWLDEDENGNGLLFLTEDDSVYFTAADVRQLQLAKAAVAAGISVLMQQSGLDFDEVEALYLAGGFGVNMRPESAVEIGMLPRALLKKIVPVGNSSLAGAQQALLSCEKREKLFEIKENCGYLELSGHEGFNAAYPAHMSFDEEEIEWNCDSL